jgi:hypothetical protein
MVHISGLLLLATQLILTWQLNRPSDIHHSVIPAKAGTQWSHCLLWIPALRSAAAGMTNLVAGLIC